MCQRVRRKSGQRGPRLSEPRASERWSERVIQRVYVGDRNQECKEREKRGGERKSKREREREGREGGREVRERETVTGTDREPKSMNICRGNGLKL
jgi:hypothetical protein